MLADKFREFQTSKALQIALELTDANGIVGQKLSAVH